MILENFEISYDFKFDPIKSYLDSTQEMIINQEKELKEKYDNWNAKHGQNPEMPDAFDIYEMDILNSSEFGNILNKSIYLTVYSTFENEFFKLCEWCKNAKKLTLGPKDLNGSGGYIGQCRKYVVKVLNVNLDGLNDQWTNIGKYQLIRNSIAHNNGILKDLKKENLDFINNSAGISIDLKSSEIQIDSVTFLKNMIDYLVEFLINVITEIVNEKAIAST